MSEPVFFHDKQIGEIIGDCFQTYRDQSHFMRMYRGFGISIGVLAILVTKRVRTIKIIYNGASRRIYEFPIEQYINSELVYNDRGDVQKFVSIQKVMAPQKEETFGMKQTTLDSHNYKGGPHK